jgi:hypothetical protein
VVVLGDEDAALGDEAAGGGSGGLHQGFPVAAGGVGFVAGFACDEFGGFGGADGFASVTVGFAIGEELQDGGFEGGVLFAGVVAAAGFAAIFEDVPVAGVLFGPVEGALAGLAEFFLAWGGAVGFGFAVGHGLRRFYALRQRGVVCSSNVDRACARFPTHAMRLNNETARIGHPATALLDFVTARIEVRMKMGYPSCGVSRLAGDQ